MPLKPKGGEQLRGKATSFPPMPSLKSEVIAQGKLDKGMVTVIDPMDIDPGALVSAKNVRIRFDKPSRRSGTALLTPTFPDALPVLSSVVMKKSNGNLYLIRITPSTVYQLVAGVWTLMTTITPLTGTVNNRWMHSLVLDKFLGANGVDVLRNIDPVAGTYEKLSASAPIVKFVTGFFNRAVVAGYANGQAGVTYPGVWIGWSADGDPTQFDPTVDQTAGSGPLEDNPYDIADFITGLYGFDNSLLVLREKSVWVGVKQPIPTNPFYFYQAVPGIGCNAPYSLAIVPDGAVWLDTRTGTVWRYTIGGQLNLYRGQIERIGLPVETSIMASVTDPNQVFGDYDSTHNEYTVCVPIPSTNIVRMWTYNFNSKTWTFDEQPNLTCLYSTDPFVQATGTIIGNLVGTIGGLTGTIAQLGVSTSPPIQVTRNMGRSDGTIIVDSPGVFTDAGVAYNSDVVTKQFGTPEYDLYFAQVRVDFLIRTATTINLYITKDGGQTWILVKTKTITDPTKLNKPLRFFHNKQHKATRFQFWFQVTSGDFDILGYELRVYPSGTTRNING